MRSGSSGCTPTASCVGRSGLRIPCWRHTCLLAAAADAGAAYAASHVQHMQKALEQMNVKLTEVAISDIAGVTGLSIIDAILKGQRDPIKLAQLRYVGCHHS